MATDLTPYFTDRQSRWDALPSELSTMRDSKDGDKWLDEELVVAHLAKHNGETKDAIRTTLPAILQERYQTDDVSKAYDVIANEYGAIKGKRVKGGYASMFSKSALDIAAGMTSATYRQIGSTADDMLAIAIMEGDTRLQSSKARREAAVAAKEHLEQSLAIPQWVVSASIPKKPTLKEGQWNVIPSSDPRGRATTEQLKRDYTPEEQAILQEAIDAEEEYGIARAEARKTLDAMRESTTIGQVSQIAESKGKGIAKWAEEVGKEYDIDPEVEGSFTGALTQGAASLALMFGTRGRGLELMMADEQVKDYAASLGKDPSELTMSEMKDGEMPRILYALAGGQLEKIGFKSIFSNISKRELRRMTVKQLARRVAVEAGRSGAAEGTTEGLQGQLMSIMAAIDYDPQRDPFSAEELESRMLEFAVGFLLGGGTSVATTGRGAGEQRAELRGEATQKITAKDGLPYGEQDFSLMGDVKTDDEIRAMAPTPELGDLMVKAAHGDKEAQKAYMDEILEEIPEAEVVAGDIGTTRGFAFKSPKGNYVYTPEMGSIQIKDQAQFDRTVEEMSQVQEIAEGVALHNELKDTAPQGTYPMPVVLALPQAGKVVVGVQQPATIQEGETEYEVRDPSTGETITTAATQEEAEREAFIWQNAQLDAQELSFTEDMAQVITERTGQEFETMAKQTVQDQVDAGTISEEQAIANVAASTGQTAQQVREKGLSNYSVQGQSEIKDDVVITSVAKDAMYIMGSNQADHTAEGRTVRHAVLGDSVDSVFSRIHVAANRIAQGSSPLAPIEEAAESYLKLVSIANGGKATELDPATRSSILFWKERYEAEGGTEEAGATDVDLIEWFSSRAIDYAMSSYAMDSKKEMALMPNTFQKFMYAVKRYAKVLFARAEQMKRMREQGTLPKGLETALRQGLGYDQATGFPTESIETMKQMGFREPVATATPAPTETEQEQADDYYRDFVYISDEATKVEDKEGDATEWAHMPEEAKQTGSASTILDLSGYEAGYTAELPVEGIVVNKDVPQFKGDSDPDTGVVDELQGTYQRVPWNPIVVWDKTSGEHEVVTGRHRLALARKSGESTIPAQVVRERDGFTLDMAITLDAEANIRDNMGDVKDYAYYFKNSPQIEKPYAKEQGLLRTAKGQAGWHLGKNASDDLYTLYANGEIGEAKAVAIAKGAPKHDSAQRLAIKNARGRNAGELELLARNYSRMEGVPTEAAEQASFFDMDDSFEAIQREAEAEAKAQWEMIEETKGLLAVAKAPSRNPKAAKKLGIDIKDVDALSLRVKQLKELLEELKNPSTATRNEIRAAASLEPIVTQVAPTFQAREDAREEAFYSKLEQVLAQKVQGKQATAQQVMAAIRKGAVKAEEIKWSGIEQWLEDNSEGGKVKTADLMDYVRTAGKVIFEEVNLGIDEAEVDILLEDEAGEGMTREEARDYLITSENAPQYSEQQLDGGENYREVVLTTKPPRRSLSEAAEAHYELFIQLGGEPAWSELSDERQKEIIDGLPAEATAPINEYSSPRHFQDIPNYVAHMRLNERTDAEGKDGLFIEEIQSDRHQDGRKEGYGIEAGLDKATDELNELLSSHFKGAGKPPPSPVGRTEAQTLLRDRAYKDYTAGIIGEENYNRLNALAYYDSKPIPDAPFRKDWSLQMFKRALRDAVASGKDWIGWTDGQTQADRYDLSKHLSEVKYTDGDLLTAYDPDGAQVINERVSHEGLPAAVGKELAAKIIEDSTKKKEADGQIRSLLMQGKDEEAHALREATLEIPYRYSGLDLKVGGEGMKGFYDVMLPKAIGKYVKQWGAKVESVTIEAGTDQEVRWSEDTDGLQNVEHKSRMWQFETEEEAKAKVEELEKGATPIHRINITDAMRKDVTEKGQPSFQATDQTETPEFKAWFGDSKVVDEEGKPLVVYHGGDKLGFDVFDTEGAGKTEGTGAFFTSDYHMATTYAKKRDIISPAPSLENIIEDPEAYNFNVSYSDRYEVWIAETPHGEEVEGDTKEEALENAHYQYDHDELSGIYSVFLSIKDPMVIDAKDQGWDNISLGWDLYDKDGYIIDTVSEEEEAKAMVESETADSYSRSYPETTDSLARLARDAGADGVIIKNVSDEGSYGQGGSLSDVYIAFSPTQIKSVTDNRGTFDPNDPRITHQATDQTETPEFKAWFGDSKVVDENGEPLVVYHGTARGGYVTDINIDEFDYGKIGDRWGQDRAGFFFTDDLGEADFYGTAERVEVHGHGVIYPVYLSLKNPLVITSDQDIDLGSEGTVGYWDARHEELIQKVRKGKHDGVILHDKEIQHQKLMVAFNPEQIKSATGNRGTFDPTDPRITHQAAENEALNADLSALRIAELEAQFEAEIQQERIMQQQYREALYHPIQKESGSVGRAFINMNTRLRNASLEIFKRNRTYRRNISKRTGDYYRRTEDAQKLFKQLREEDRRAMGLALMNQDHDTALRIASKVEGLNEAMLEVFEVLEEIRKYALAAGYEIGYLTDYFPRKLKKRDELLSKYGLADDNRIAKAIREADKKAANPLTTEQKDKIVSDIISGNYRSEGKPSNFKERKINKLTLDDYVEFYALPWEALNTYITNTVQAVETRKFLGKAVVEEEVEMPNISIDEADNIAVHADKVTVRKVMNQDESIARLIRELEEEGKLTHAEIEEVIQVIRAELGFQPTVGKTRIVRNLGYLTTMFKPSVALLQLEDISTAVFAGRGIRGIRPIAAYFDTDEFSIARDLGLDSFSVDEKDAGYGLNTFMTWGAKWSGLHFLGKGGVNNQVNTALRSYRYGAKHGKLSTVQEMRLTEFFAGDAEQIAQLKRDLAAGRMTDDVNLLGWNLMLDMQPLDLSEMPSTYAEHPKGRIMYMLKSFTLKRFDIFRREGIRMMHIGYDRKDYKLFLQGLRRLLWLMMMYYVSGVSVNYFRDFVTGKDPVMEDEAVSGLFSLFGTSRYAYYQAETMGADVAAASQVAPPMPWLTYPTQDIFSMTQGDFDMGDAETWRAVPVLGDWWYWYLGGGVEKKQNRRARQKGNVKPKLKTETTSTKGKPKL